MAQTQALEMRSIHKAFYGNQVLRDVDFSVSGGSIHALLGANGAGKSTLMKIATGVQKPDTGSLIVGGRALQPGRSRDVHHAGLGMVYQDLSLIETLSVAANVFLGRSPGNETAPTPYIRRRTEIEESDRIFDRIGVNIDPRVEVRDLSLADKQIVEIAKALVVARTCLILDEPTTALSVREIDRLFRAVSQLRDDGLGVIFITHHLQEVFEICDAVTVLRDGAISYQGGTDDVTTADLVRAMVAEDVAEATAPDACDRPPASQPILSVEHLSVPKCVHDVSFELRAGEILGIAGLAGSGSNELIRSLAGVEPGATGRVVLRKKRLRSLASPRRAIASGLYLIPGSRKSEGLVTNASIQSNLVLSALRNYTCGGVLQFGRIQKFASRMMASLNIKANSPDQLIDELSGGNQQKVVIAKALATDAAVFLLEEPTFGVDIHASRDIADAMRTLAGRGSSCMWLTTDLRELAQVSDRVLHIDSGRLVGVIDNRQRSLTEAQLLELIHSAEVRENEVKSERAIGESA